MLPSEEANDKAGQPLECPACGASLEAAHPAQEAGPLRCPSCGSLIPPGEQQRSGSDGPKSRFRRLLAPSRGAPPDNPAPGKWGPLANSPIASTLDASLRDRGFVLTEDGHGVRLSGDAIGRGRGRGDLTPSDVLRLAAELEGGLPADDEKMVCPACKAVVLRSEACCPWCSEPLSPRHRSSRAVTRLINPPWKGAAERITAPA